MRAEKIRREVPAGSFCPVPGMGFAFQVERGEKVYSPRLWAAVMMLIR